MTHDLHDQEFQTCYTCATNHKIFNHEDMA